MKGMVQQILDKSFDVLMLNLVSPSECIVM